MRGQHAAPRPPHHIAALRMDRAASDRIVNRPAIATIAGVNAAIPPNYRLRMPGPAAVPERVRAACALPVMSHRGPEFRAIIGEVTQSLRGILGTRQDVFLLGTSGTGGMEAALVNVLSAGDALLVVENGQFGERFSSIAAQLPVKLDRMPIPWGEVPDATEIAARVKAKA